MEGSSKPCNGNPARMVKAGYGTLCLSAGPFCCAAVQHVLQLYSDSHAETTEAQQAKLQVHAISAQWFALTRCTLFQKIELFKTHPEFNVRLRLCCLAK